VAYPKNVVLSAVSMIDSHEAEPGHIIHEEHDMLYVGPFHNPNMSADEEKLAALSFIRMYAAGGKKQCLACEDVHLARWKKLVFNACMNPICAITGLDDSRVRLADGDAEGLVRPAMKEIVTIAAAVGHVLPEAIIDTMIDLDPWICTLSPGCNAILRKYDILI
jgi:ketopantoate reductase